MTKTEIKQTAQEELLSAMGVAFHRLEEAFAMEKRKEIRDEMSKQMARVEKLFGYKPNSFLRGC